jgi:hypothetical protein
VAILYDQIRGVRRRIEKNMDKQLAEDFDKHLKNVMVYLSSKLSVPDNSNLNKAVAVLDTKKALFDICFDKANEYMSQTDQAASEIYSQLFMNFSQIFSKAFGFIDVLTQENKQLKQQ